MDYSNNLNQLQRDFLAAWFASTQDYFLTGGGALIGYYGSPRTTKDLDLFTLSKKAFSRANQLVHDVTDQIGATSLALNSSPYFKRFRIERDDEKTLVDIVEDLAPQVFPNKKTDSSGVVLDPLEEIAVNKVCAIVGRSEPRDFFDFHYLVTQGADPAAALASANLKDGGVDAESVVMVLQSVNWNTFRLPGQDGSAVADFFQNWLEDLTVQLHPKLGDAKAALEP